MSSSRLRRPRLSATAPVGEPDWPPPNSSEELTRVAELLIAAHDASSGATLVRMVHDGDDMKFGLLPVPDDLDPLDLLLCSDTPDEWEVLGMIVNGRIIDRPDDGIGAARRRTGSSRVAVLMRRDGSTVTVLDSDGDQQVLETDADTMPIEGRFADAMRRSLGLTTAPPEVGVRAAIARVWLHRVHTVAVDGRPLDAEVVAALRPPMPRSWSDLRQQCADGGWTELRCDPDLAAWMDDGMFARWCMAAFPDPSEALVDVGELIPPRAAEPLAEALAAWR